VTRHDRHLLLFDTTLREGGDEKGEERKEMKKRFSLSSIGDDPRKTRSKEIAQR
jgi:hypothetical protein